VKTKHRLGATNTGHSQAANSPNEAPGPIERLKTNGMGWDRFRARGYASNCLSVSSSSVTEGRRSVMTKVSSSLTTVFVTPGQPTRSTNDRLRHNQDATEWRKSMTLVLSMSVLFLNLRLPAMVTDLPLWPALPVMPMRWTYLAHPTIKFHWFFKRLVTHMQKVLQRCREQGAKKTLPTALQGARCPNKLTYSAAGSKVPKKTYLHRCREQGGPKKNTSGHVWARLGTSGHVWVKAIKND